jgi:hypothetical protein
MNKEPTALVLDIKEVPKSHSGDNMSTAIAEIVTDFGIEDKVSS